MLSETSNKIPLRIEYMRIFLKKGRMNSHWRSALKTYRLSEWEARKILKILRMLKMHKMLKMLEMLKWLKMSKKYNTYKIRKKKQKKRKMAQKGILFMKEFYLLDQCRILRTAGIAFGLNIMPLDTMMTWTFFQVVLHLTKVIQNFMVITLYLNNFLEVFCWTSETLEENSWKIVTFFCYEFCFRQRRRGADDWQVKTNKKCHIFFKNFLQEFLKFSKKFQRNC